MTFKHTFTALLVFTMAACQSSQENTETTSTTENLLTVDSVDLGAYFPDTLLNRFQGEIDRFAQQDSIQPPPENAALFVGSSSIRKWETIQKDLSPIPVINRGFGGSTAPEALYYFDELVAQYQPREVFYYEGDNDLSMAELNMTPEKVLETFKIFVNTVKAKVPSVEKIYFLSIKPSISRRSLLSTMQEANQLIETYAGETENVYYLDVADKMMNTDGTIRSDIFVGDSLHMNETGYALWTEVVKPELMKDYND